MSVLRAGLVFGGLGVVWASQLAALMRIGCYAHDDAFQYFGLPVIIPAMSVIGCILAWHAGASRPVIERVLVPVLLVPLTGLVLGVVDGLVWWPDAAGVQTGAIYGLVFGTAALVFLAPLIVAMQRVARPRSLMDGAYGYTMWSIAACVGCASALVAALPWKDYPNCALDPLQPASAAIGSGIACLGLAVLQWFHVRTSRRLLAATPHTVDIGIHDDSIDYGLPPAPVYRRTTVPPAVLYASHAQAIMDWRVRLAVACAVVALVLAGTALGFQGIQG